jgi:putative membrane protein
MRSLIRAAAAACAVALGVATLPAEDKKEKDKGVPFTDEAFVVLAASGGTLEVELGKLAKTNAANPEVQKFGERMVTDHTKANKNLAEAAKSAGLGLPVKLLPDHQKHLDHFAGLKGAAFDTAYMKHMVADHKEDIALFERATKEAKNEKVKALATQTLPTLREHLKLAEKVNAGLKGGK